MRGEPVSIADAMKRFQLFFNPIPILMEFDGVLWEKKNGNTYHISPEGRKKIESLDVEETFSLEDCFEGKAFVPAILGEHIAGQTHFKTLRKGKEMYRYVSGVYRDDGEVYFEVTCKEILGTHFKLNYLNETKRWLMIHTYVDESELTHDWVNVENGLYNPASGEFRDHTPDIFSTVQLPLMYDPDATCPLWEETLRSKVNEEIYLTLQEFFGYCFLPGQRYEKALLLFGQRETMKSTTLRILEEMLGKEQGNTKSISLQTLAEDHFAIAYLYGKIANIHADLDHASLKNVKTFMTLVGGDTAGGRKLFKGYFEWTSSCKLIFSCNQIPGTQNKTLAFYRRWLPIPFNVPHDKRDNYMTDKLKKEIVGIFNWALKGLERLREQDHFTYNPSAEEIKEMYERNSDTVSAYVLERIDADDPLGLIAKRIIFADYVQWCNDAKLVHLQPSVFGRQFTMMTGCGGHKRTGAYPAYSGISFKEGHRISLGGKRIV